MRSVNQGHVFSQVPRAEIPRSVFDRSHNRKSTFNAGYLVPIFVDFALPGDTFNLRASMFARMATPRVPIMDNMFAETFFFAVPVRLLWTNFQRFMGEQDDPGDSTDFLEPQMTSVAATYAVESIYDYMGLPTAVTGYTHSALPLRAYNLIWNEWFRDQNLQNSVTVNKGDGPDPVTDYTILRRGKRHDYFTSCLPWPQKGDSVVLPLGTSAPIKGQSDSGTVNDQLYLKTSTGTIRYGVLQTLSGSTTPATRMSFDADPGSTQTLKWQQDGDSTHPSVGGFNYADLSAATAATINELRQAFQLQRLYERDARGGTRYTEIVRSHFGVVSPDARLQRPEYLGGGSTQITTQPVPQTSSTDATTPQGNLSAYASFSDAGHGFVKSFTEHTVVLGLICVRADLNYQQGLNRMWSRRTRLDWYWPSLGHIGEQAVLNKEIYCTGVSATDEAVFGYQERYAEYRYKPSEITGKFRSTYATPLDQWHLAQEFSSLPTLGNTFIQENPPVERVIAVTTEPHFLFDARFNFKCARPMGLYGVPGNIDRF